ncbi:MAG: peptide chain release factor N(5)-glutamine methyltransferase [Acidimicrobiales bacterium]
MTWQDLLDEATARVGSADARRIVEELSGHSGAELVLARNEPVTVGAVAAFDRMVARRAEGEPLQYVLGRWAFRTLDLAVDRRVLIPRPETESLVDLALAHVDRLAADRGREPVVVVDLGTGSGAVGLSIAAERTNTTVWATDRSADALSVARANLAGLGRAGTRVRLAEGSWFDALVEELVGVVDVVVSNPPYVMSGDPLPADVEEWEPAAALRSGDDGLDDLRAIVAGAPRWLRPGGALVVELDPRQAVEVETLAAAAGFAETATHADLTGRDRFVSAVLR